MNRVGVAGIIGVVALGGLGTKAPQFCPLPFGPPTSIPREATRVATSPAPTRSALVESTSPGVAAQPGHPTPR